MSEIFEDKGIQVEKKDKLNIVLDMSSFDLFETCEQKYNYRHNQLKTEPIHKKSKALDKGSLGHEGLEVYYKLLKEQIPFADRMHKAIERINFFSSDPEQCNLEEIDIRTVISAVEQSCDYWRFEDEQFEILEVERAFAYVLYEDDFIRIVITGKIDLLVNIPSIGRRSGYTNHPLDHKTYERDSEVPELSNQFQNYCVATNSFFLTVNRVGLQKTLKPEDKFQRPLLSYDASILNQWKRNTKNIILRRYLDCIATGEWDMNFTSCFKFNRRCEYYEICKTGNYEDKMYKLTADFATTSPWDVTAKFKKN